VGAAGRTHVEEKFAWSRLAGTARAHYERAIEAKKAVNV
jgi:hypothetical protein